MKASTVILAIIYCACLYAQYHGIYSHYFEFTNSDKVSLGLSLVLPFFITYRFYSADYFRVQYICPMILILLPLLTQPILSKLVGWSDYTWLVVHFLVGLGGVAAASTHKTRHMVFPLVAVLATWIIPFDYQQSQTKYYDKVVTSIETRKGSGQIVQWKNDYWVHYNSELQFSTIDDHVLQEAFIQPVMHFNSGVEKVLIIGDDEGLLSCELSKFASIRSIVHIPHDKDYHDFVIRNAELLKITPNKNTEVLTTSVQFFLADTTGKFDLIIVDLAEPEKNEFLEYYSSAFYKLCFNKLKADGSLVTKIAKAYPQFVRIEKIQQKVGAAGFNQLPYHVQIPSIGQCSWILGSKNLRSNEMLASLTTINPKVETTWWDLNAMKMMLSFGKNSYFTDLIKGNTYLNR